MRHLVTIWMAPKHMWLLFQIQNQADREVISKPVDLPKKERKKFWIKIWILLCFHKQKRATDTNILNVEGAKNKKMNK